MTRSLPNLVEQRATFEDIRALNERELRNTGFEKFIEERGIDPDLGRIVVARVIRYSTQLADIDIGLDPHATPLAVEYEVGMREETERFSSYRGIVVSSALRGGSCHPTESQGVIVQSLATGEAPRPVGPGKDLDYVQHAVVRASVERLLMARKKFLLPSLTKSLLKIDPAGD